LEPTAEIRLKEGKGGQESWKIMGSIEQLTRNCRQIWHNTIALDWANFILCMQNSKT